MIAFSTFDQTPPSRQPVRPSAPDVGTSGKAHVLCTNPAALGGGSGKLDPIFPSKPFAPGIIATGQLAADDHPADAHDRVGEHPRRLQRALLVGAAAPTC